MTKNVTIGFIRPIDPMIYSMTPQEIVNELESKGYSVEKQGDRFKIS
jgi:hypothetical protein